MVIGITYYPRKEQTIFKSIASLRETFDGRVIIYCDGFDIDCGEETIVKENIGCFKHYARSLEHLVNQGSDEVLLMADDFIYKPNWIKTVYKKINRPKIGFCAIYTPYGLGKKQKWSRGSLGWREINGGFYSSWGGGYVMKTEVAKQLLQHPFFINHRDNYKENQQIDHCIPEVMYRLKLRQMGS